LLQQMLALARSEAYQQQMAASGMKVSEPVARVVNANTVYRWQVEIDEEAFLKQMREAGATDPRLEDIAPLKQLMDLFLSGYDYAATPEGLVFGITDDAGIGKAMALLGGAQAAGSTILERVAAPVSPYMVARVDLLGLIGLGQKLAVAPIPEIAGRGEGILLAGWRSGDAVEQVMLIPAGDIRLLRQAAMAAQQ